MGFLPSTVGCYQIEPQASSSKHQTTHTYRYLFSHGFLLNVLVTSNICLTQLQHTGVKVERIGVSGNDTGSVRHRLIVLSCGH